MRRLRQRARNVASNSRDACCRHYAYQDYNEWPVPGFKPNCIESVIRCVRRAAAPRTPLLRHVTSAARNDDMWLLSSVPLEGGGQSRKWLNWRDLYYPGGFIKCSSPQSRLSTPPAAAPCS